MRRELPLHGARQDSTGRRVSARRRARAASKAASNGSGGAPQSLRSRTIPFLRERIPFIGLGVVLALIAAYWVVHRTPAPPKPPPKAVFVAHGCTLRHFPSAGRKHVSGSKPPTAYRIEYVAPSHLGKNPDGTTVKYDSFPPTSGPHYPQWVTWGAYGKPLPEIAAVHNLEHGGVIVQYGAGRTVAR